MRPPTASGTRHILLASRPESERPRRMSYAGAARTVANRIAVLVPEHPSLIGLRGEWISGSHGKSTRRPPARLVVRPDPARGDDREGRDAGHHRPHRQSWGL